MLKGLDALNEWLNRPTWHTGQTDDLATFFLAIKEIINQNPYILLHECVIAAYIKNSQSGKMDANELERLATEYSQKALLISEYVMLTTD
ncbi:hypothetical protein KXR87_07285 [Yokenella regensburgei]|uniref:hypothetical protein n=1 Tax=Yokenella regensburgei TaxID=158877 RepID=UPI003F183D6D